MNQRPAAELLELLGNKPPSGVIAYPTPTGGVGNTKRVREGLMGNTTKPMLDLVEAQWLGTQHRQDQDRPLVGDLVQRPGNRNAAAGIFNDIEAIPGTSFISGLYRISRAL